MANNGELGVPISRAPEPNWDDVKKWREILDGERKKVIRKVLAENPREALCPCLREIAENGEVEWIYCQRRYDELKANGCTEGEKPSFADPRYRSDVDYAYLQLFCVKNFAKCIDYSGSQNK